MKIAVNLFLTSPKSITGAFIYIEDILPALFRTDSNNTYYLLGHAETIKYFKDSYHDFSNVKFRVFDIRRDIFINPFRALKKLVAKVRDDNRARENIIRGEVSAFLKKEGINIYFSPSQTIYPRGLDDIKHVTTILDLQFDYFPENFSTHYLEERRRDAKYAVDHSEKLIAISEYTKKTLRDKYNAPLDKMGVIYFAPHEIENTPVTIRLPSEFVFYPAALWPHKNHAVLIKALGILKDRFPKLCVVCAGVVIPLVEAMQFGVPVIAADNTSIAEVVGNAGILVKTGDAEALAGAIEKVLTDKSLRDELIEKGHERAKIFSWEKAAKETLAVFNSI